MPTKYEFQSTLHRNQSEMLDAIAYEWLTAGGLNDPAAIDDMMQDFDADEAAAECIADWGLDETPDPRDDEGQSHMELNGYDADDLAAAFSRFISDRPDRED